MARSNCSAFIEQRYAICLIYYGITNLKYPLIHYFGDLIKKETGVSAQEYILTKIMDRAKELLTDPAKSVGDVAYALGYQYPQYFSKAFKRVVGCSPNEYRTLS